MKLALALLLVLSLGWALALAPGELLATQTVGQQARANRTRVMSRSRGDDHESIRVCTEGEVSTDRRPCLATSGMQHAPAQ